MPTPAELIKQRKSTHGSFHDNARISQALKDVFRKETDYALLNDEQKEALDLIALKLARILSGQPNRHDHWEDIAGYSTLASQSIIDIS